MDRKDECNAITNELAPSVGLCGFWPIQSQECRAFKTAIMLGADVDRHLVEWNTKIFSPMATSSLEQTAE
ncbi:hypothetical protein Y032_0006g2989 [Ancylostoma ceylanicum]|uniref:Uncharacterized protein n=1 Tax=Ancylostoma ceylanicum TaxID=53326 RepID=A0A016VR09_9BILA|nr:hypothetical protein Y032_0006g2989 [Ancylostoma ceylanicum]